MDRPFDVAGGRSDKESAALSQYLAVWRGVSCISPKLRQRLFSHYYSAGNEPRGVVSRCQAQCTVLCTYSVIECEMMRDNVPEGGAIKIPHSR